ncbi:MULTISPECIES: ferritin-like domain-containing protein [Bordetella]|nr:MULTISPECIES: ferritin-like domain-containing protein [Bordetella]MDM9559746.1 ferritin-like domain-containing protein [Bordetella petrii]
METKTPTHEAEKHFMDWLRDAHAMEEQAESMLEGMASRLEHYPDLKRRVEQHIQETREQARLVKQCIESRGGDTSVLKVAAGKTMGAAQAFSGMLVGDEVVKGAMFGYTFEHMEIAAYRNLIEAAKVVGDIQTQQTCERILGEELAMAAWLEQNMAGVVRQYLLRSDYAEDKAKR